MKIKKECIGQFHSVQAPNGIPISVTIVDESSLFSLYKLLGLDVFEVGTKSAVTEVKINTSVSEVVVPKKKTKK